jgi:hypothetical protein
MGVVIWFGKPTTRTGTRRHSNFRGSERPPESAEGELLVRVGACAVCRTDLQIATGDLAAHRAAVIPGHQAVGVVEAIGPGVEGWTIGERAGTTWLAGFDGTCRFCRTARENLCAGATFTGWDRDGGFAELLTIRADIAVHIAVGIDDVAAAPLLCGGVIGYRALRLSRIEAGGRLGLYGFGLRALGKGADRRPKGATSGRPPSPRDRPRARPRRHVPDIRNERVADGHAKSGRRAGARAGHGVDSAGELRKTQG